MLWSTDYNSERKCTKVKLVYNACSVFFEKVVSDNCNLSGLVNGIVDRTDQIACLIRR